MICLYEYFKLLEREASLDKTDYDILTLTKMIATKAGYHRGNRTFKNGAVRECTLYDKPFDSVLSAKWLIFYRKWFIKELKNHIDLIPVQVEIINNTFLMFMSYFDMSKVVSPAQITNYVRLTLQHRINTAEFNKTSAKKIEQYNKMTDEEKKEKVILYQKNLVNNSAISYEGYLTNHNETVEFNNDTESPTEDIIIDIKKQLENNPYGEKVLDMLLYSDKIVTLKRICNYISLSESEKTLETRKYIRDAYNCIKNTLRQYTSKSYKYDWSDVMCCNIGFNGENN